MKLLRRCAWLLVWGAWVWLGVGLYRELPRELGPKIGTLPLEQFDTPLGFIGTSDRFAVQHFDRSTKRITLRVVDAASAQAVAEHPFVRLNFAVDDVEATEAGFRKPLKRGVLFGKRHVDELGFEVLDVLKGGWRSLSPEKVVCVALHPDKPWAALIEGQALFSRVVRVVVVDWETGRELFAREVSNREQLTERPFFLREPDRLVLPFGGRSRNGFLQTLEVWRMETPAVLEGKVEGIGSFERTSAPMSVSPAGRVRWEGKLERMPEGDSRRWRHFDVYDFNERRFMTTSPPEEQPNDLGQFTTTHGQVRPTISLSGRAVLRYMPSSVGGGGPWKRTEVCLYEVGDGRILWCASPHETVSGTSTEDGFLVKETWHELWKEWAPKLSYETLALRNLHDGSLIYRVSEKTVIGPRQCNAAGTMAVTEGGMVHRLPLRVKWPLLAACQAILAAPLLMVWGLVAWRRRRRKARESAATP